MIIIRIIISLANMGIRIEINCLLSRIPVFLDVMLSRRLLPDVFGGTHRIASLTSL